MDKYSYFVDQILEWYRQHGRHDLPWRKPDRTPYEVWVSEIMLQQTQVSRVIDFYNRFLDRFRTIESLSQASWEEFLPFYQGLGYYNRGRNMLKTAKIIVDQYQGKFPPNKSQLITLPGIGEYTANAILSFGFGQSHLAFDTNQQRVWGRYLYGDKKADLDVTRIENQLPTGTDFNHLNSAIMDFANLVYKNKSVDTENSPLKKYCVYCQTQGELETHNGQTKTPTHKIEQTILFLHLNHRVYFSENKTNFQPFYLPKSVNNRAQIKRYFEEKYQLQLSVRPPFRKVTLNGKNIQLVRAQILLGNHQFTSYPKKVAQQWLAKFGHE